MIEAHRAKADHNFSQRMDQRMAKSTEITPRGSAAAKKKPRKRMTQAERTALSDKRMFDAAISIIGKQGLHNTTLKDVGVLAGYSRGLASSRFGSKEALFESLIEFLNDRWTEELQRFVGGRTGLSAFVATLDAVEDFLATEPNFVTTMYTLWYESISSHSQVRTRLAQQHEMQREDFARMLRQGIDEGSVRPSASPERFAVLCCSFIFGVIYQNLVSPGSINIRQTFADFKQTSLSLIVERRRRRTR